MLWGGGVGGCCSGRLDPRNALGRNNAKTTLTSSLKREEKNLCAGRFGFRVGGKVDAGGRQTVRRSAWEWRYAAVGRTTLSTSLGRGEMKVRKRRRIDGRQELVNGWGLTIHGDRACPR